MEVKFWLGEFLSDQADATHVPRRVKDVEERLFAHRRTLFSDLLVVLFDTTSLYFYGAAFSACAWLPIAA